MGKGTSDGPRMESECQGMMREETRKKTGWTPPTITVMFVEQSPGGRLAKLLQEA